MRGFGQAFLSWQAKIIIIHLFWSISFIFILKRCFVFIHFRSFSRFNLVLIILNWVWPRWQRLANLSRKLKNVQNVFINHDYYSCKFFYLYPKIAVQAEEVYQMISSKTVNRKRDALYFTNNFRKNEAYDFYFIHFIQCIWCNKT